MNEDSDAEALKAEIGQARADLAETVDQLAGKLDVKAQAADKAQLAAAAVSDKAQQAAAAVNEKAQQTAAKVRSALPDTMQQKVDVAAAGLQRSAQRVADSAGPAAETARRHRRELLWSTAVAVTVLYVWTRRHHNAR